LRDICAPQGIKITIESPFDNAFGSLPLLSSADSLTKHILSILQLKESVGEITQEEVLQKELEVVNRCLALVTENDVNPLHKKVWQDFITKNEALKKLTTLKALFKIANAVMIGVASYKKRDDEVCSLMPLSGKQIQRGYTTYSGDNPDYPRTVNLTFMDPIIGYNEEMDLDPDNKDKGLLFYVDDRGTASKTIHGLFQTASRNASGGSCSKENSSEDHASLTL